MSTDFPRIDVVLADESLFHRIEVDGRPLPCIFDDITSQNGEPHVRLRIPLKFVHLTQHRRDDDR